MLEKIDFDEAKQSQLAAVELLVNLGYKYISREEVVRERGGDTSQFLLLGIAEQKLMELNGYDVEGKHYQFSPKDVHDTVYELAHQPFEGLLDTAQKIYHTIMPTSGGKTIKVNVGGRTHSQNFRYIDFDHPENNAYHVTVEYVATGRQNIRIDIVCFVNGIPFAIIENKKSSVKVTEAAAQNYRNQGIEFCPRFYAYTQLLTASNVTEFTYGTTGTTPEFYANWREKGTPAQEFDSKIKQYLGQAIDPLVYQQILVDLNGNTANHHQLLERQPTVQDRALVSLFVPTRLLDLAKNYILFDAGIKKITRYQQYFAIRAMFDRISTFETTTVGIHRRQGGLIWHTQGSGKSLTMVMFVKALIENQGIINPRIIIVTDRRDLDKQIKDTFKSCNLKKEVIQARSGRHLLELIKSHDLSVITTIIDKFESVAKKSDFVDPDSNIFVLIDEAHRSQGGIANLEMNKIIPNACYIGFTGTPLMTQEKESWRKFGGYIDRYTIDDALTDNVILPLIYEGRYADLTHNADKIDQHVDRVSEDLSRKYNVTIDESVIRQQQAQITADVLANNPQRLEEIARDIESHYLRTFKHTGLKAQIVAPSKFAAITIQQSLDSRGQVSSAVVISDEHDDGDKNSSHKQIVLKYLQDLHHLHHDLQKYERDIIDSFKHSPEGIELLIVVDKLLTGFDAPRNTVLYLLKDLRNHNLLQAIARVNRLFDNKKLPKTAGYIIDYSENAKNLDTAMKLFGNYDQEDVHNSLIDVQEKISELEESYSVLHDIFRQVSGTRDTQVYIDLLSDGPTRDHFYKALSSFTRNLGECYVLQDFVHSFPHLDRYRHDLKKFTELRRSASLQYADRVDLAEYKQALINILDKYVDAKEVELLTQQISITDRKAFKEAVEELGSDRSKAEAIAAQTERTITELYDHDPELYDRFSKKVSAIIQSMRQGKLADIDALRQLKKTSVEVISSTDDTLPQAVQNNPGADILYRNLKKYFMDTEIIEPIYIEIVLDIYKIIKKNAIIDWYKNYDVKRRLMNSLDDYLYEELVVKKGFKLNSSIIKNIIQDVLTLSEYNHEKYH